MSLAVSGHGATLAYEQDPSGAQGTFTTVAEVVGDLPGISVSRPWTDTTPHGDTIDSGVVGVATRDPLTVSLNYLFSNGTHDHLTGLKKIHDDGTFTGFRLLGPGGSANTDEIIASGHVVAFKVSNPAKEGARSAEVTIQFSKRYKQDGVLIGQAA